MLRVYYSNRTEELLAAFIERMDDERSSLFDTVHVVVPNRNMRTYLELALARTTGVCTNIRFYFPDELFGRRPDLTNRVLTALFDESVVEHAELEPVRTYLAAAGSARVEVDRRRVQLGRELARLYSRYVDYRPELIDCWRAGLFVGEGDSRDVETWQRRLWLGLPESGSDAVRDVPAPLHVFGVSYMPRGQIELLGRIAGDVFLYTLNPCQEIWEATSAPVPLAKASRRYERRGKDLGPGEVFSVDDPFRLANPGEMLPLRLWGRAGRENLRLTNALTGCELIPRINVERGARESAAGDRGTASRSLLEQLQQDIALRKPERRSIAKEQDFSGDESIVILEAPNVRRELETIGTEIWKLLAVDDAVDDEPLRFNDIAVILVPSVAEHYQALIGSVFSEMHEIPHNIVDLPVRSESKLIEAVELLLRIPTSQFTRKEIMRFVSHPLVMSSFPEASRDEWLSWCDALGIVRGVDRDDHEPTYIKKDVFNWDQGLKRLALGAYMSGEPSGDERLFEQANDTYLVEETTPDELASAAGLGLFLRSLVSDAREVTRVQMTTSAWADFIVAFITTYVIPRSPEDERALRKCLSVVASLVNLTLGGKKVTYAVALELVRAELAELSGSRGQYLVDGVVVSSFLPMRAIPFKVVFVAGLGEGQFPAPEHRNHLDLRQSQTRAGDVSPRERDKYSFLETLLSTRERLYLSYVARDELTGETLQPSSMVLELVDTLHRGYIDDVARRTVPRRRVDDESLQRTSPRAAREMNVRALGKHLRDHLGRASLPAVARLGLGAPVLELLRSVSPPPPSENGDPDASVSLAAIRRFLECPLQGSARFALRLSETSEGDRLSREDEVFQAAPLERAQLLRETFRLGGGAARYDELAHRFELRGERPTGLFGEAERERHLRIVASWRRSLSAAAGVDGTDLELSFREPASCVFDGTRVDLGPHSLLQLTSPRLSIRLCAQHKNRFHPQRESLYGFLDHVFNAAAGAVVGEPYAFVVINAAPDESPEESPKTQHFERFTFAPMSREEATRYLVGLINEMTRGVHDYLLPCEVAFNGLSPLPPARTSSRFGPVQHPEDYEPPEDSRAKDIVDRRFGLYFESLRKASGDGP